MDVPLSFRNPEIKIHRLESRLAAVDLSSAHVV
jgi:hypothetical protein